MQFVRSRLAALGRRRPRAYRLAGRRGRGRFLSDHYGGPVMLFALLLGMAMNFLSEVDRCRPGIAFASRTVLRLGVALLGFRITLGQIAALGWQPVALVIAVVDADHSAFDRAGTLRWDSIRSSACCPAAPRRSAEPRRRWRFPPPSCSSAKGTRDPVHHHRRVDPVDRRNDPLPAHRQFSRARRPSFRNLHRRHHP